MSLSKNISLLLFILTFSSLHAQDNFLLDSVIATNLTDNSISNETYYTYDSEDRISRIENTSRITKYSYPSTDMEIVEIFNPSDTINYTLKTVKQLDSQNRVTYQEIYSFSNGEEVLTSIDTLKYLASDIDFYYFRRYAIIDSEQVKQSAITYFYNNDGFIDSTSVVNFETTGEIKSSINRGITLNADNQDSIIANRRFFNSIQYLDSSYLTYDNLELTEYKTIRYEEGEFDMTFLYQYVREGNKLTQIGYRSDDNVEFYHANDLIYWETESDYIEFDSTYNISYADDIVVSTYVNTFIVSEPLSSQILVSEISKRIANGEITQNNLEEFYYNDRNIVAVDDLEQANFTIYPNPILGSSPITIEGHSEFDRVEILNSSGAIIDNFEIQRQRQTSFLAPKTEGVYFVKLYDGNSLIGKIQRMIVIN